MRNKNSRSKSTRKPFKQISSEDNITNQLFLVRSDLSNLIQQIDELVVQAENVKGKREEKEINTFTNVLSNMHSSLKAWMPMLQSALSAESENQLEQFSPSQTFTSENVDESPVHFDLESLVSPSPLVSWCGERAIESGRQLFLLTPLPRSKQVSSKRRGLSRSVFEKTTDAPFNTNLGIPSLNFCHHVDEDLLEGKETKSIQNSYSKSFVTETKSSLDHGFVSPAKFVHRNHTAFLMTPRLKLSPPKSCVLLEPISESCQQDRYVPKSTPYHVGSQTTSSPLSSYFSERLTLKYPELFGPQQARMGRKQIDPPDCCMSPLKSCVLMEPPDGNLMKSLADDGKLSIKGCTLDKQTTTLAAAMYKDVRGDQLAKQTFVQEPGSTSIAFVDSTPIWKEPESRTNIGNQPGENTLKKELWREFEAASSSSNVLRLDASVFRDTTRKGFLDRLEEVCEDMSSEPEGLS
ncbi:hypothetical protein IFM89_027963 [Coptis chinensis]|uniref:Uncharacterized protein n=1 Tax=Coptis chinensis TaxID=261450 RepID=A0A835IFI5_9MAGN|nr:hypothetical protein IFM89_027963 [Coptis chinensis]